MESALLSFFGMSEKRSTAEKYRLEDAGLRGLSCGDFTGKMRDVDIV